MSRHAQLPPRPRTRGNVLSTVNLRGRSSGSPDNRRNGG
jgi:hypothetical protein